MDEKVNASPLDAKAINEKIDAGQVKTKGAKTKTQKSKVKKQDAKADNMALEALRRLYAKEEKPVTSTQLKDELKAKTRGVVRRQMKRLAKTGVVNIQTPPDATKGKPKYLYVPA